MREHWTAGYTFEAFDASGCGQVDDAEEVEEDCYHCGWKQQPNIYDRNDDNDSNHS